MCCKDLSSNVILFLFFFTETFYEDLINVIKESLLIDSIEIELHSIKLWTNWDGKRVRNIELGERT